MARPGTMCAEVTLSGMLGRFKLPMCVDWRVLPSGNVIVIGSELARLLRMGAVSARKWLVAPESLMVMVVGVNVEFAQWGASGLVMS